MSPRSPLARSITPSSKCELPSSPVQSRIRRIIETFRVHPARLAKASKPSLELCAATTITTVVVIPVVRLSLRRCNSAITSVPMPSRIARPIGVNGDKQEARQAQREAGSGRYWPRYSRRECMGAHIPAGEDDGDDGPYLTLGCWKPGQQIRKAGG